MDKVKESAEIKETRFNIKMNEPLELARQQISEALSVPLIGPLLLQRVTLENLRYIAARLEKLDYEELDNREDFISRASIVIIIHEFISHYGELENMQACIQSSLDNLKEKSNGDKS